MPELPLPLTTEKPHVSKSPTRILIVDDHPIVREGLIALLAGYPDLMVTGQAATISQALLQFELDLPDLVVVDLSLKDESGLDLIRRIRDRDKFVRVLVVSMHDENHYGERAFQAGATGYLNKEVAGRNIVAAIRQLMSGRVYLSKELTERILSRNLHGIKSFPSNGVDSLTDRELQVFRKIGDGLTTAQIAKDLHLSVKTIETHRQKIKTKLNLKNGAELSREAALWIVSPER